MRILLPAAILFAACVTVRVSEQPAHCIVGVDVLVTDSSQDGGSRVERLLPDGGSEPCQTVRDPDLVAE